MINLEIEELWREYIDSPTESYRDELIKRYIGFTRSLAVKRYVYIRSAKCDIDDMINSAHIAMMGCVERFKGTGTSDLDSQFKAYSSVRIKNSCMDTHWAYSIGTRNVGNKEDFSFDAFHEIPNKVDENIDNEFDKKLYNDVLVENKFNLNTNALDIMYNHITNGLGFEEIGTMKNMNYNSVRQVFYRNIRKIEKSLDGINHE